MKMFNKIFAGQSLISWFLQIALIYLAWAVADHKIVNNLYIISGAAIILILIYLSLAHDNHHRQSKK